MKLFISYAEPEGLALAYLAQATFQAAGHTVWMWDHSRTTGAWTWTEIGSHIVDADRFVYICTESSNGSYGQTEEYNIAKNNRKSYCAIGVDGAKVPPALCARNYRDVSSQEFAACCDRVAAELREVEQGIASMPTRATAEWRRYVADLRASAEKLNPERVAECIGRILEAYEAATLPKLVTSVCQVADDEAAGEFRRIGFWLEGDLAKFVDPTYHWGYFSSQLGHRVALGEQKYLYESLTAAAEVAPTTVSGRKPDFGALVQEIEAMHKAGLNPNVMLAPFQLMVPLYEQLGSRMGWSAQVAEHLTVDPGIALRVFWSDGGAPLDRFLIFIFNSAAGVWSVRPDPETGHSLTVGLGLSARHPDKVEWVAQTVVRYHVTNPRALRAVAVKGQLRTRTD